MTRKELMKLPQSQLFKVCRNRGIDATGSKSEMVDRLLEAQEQYIQSNPAPAPEAPPPEETAPSSSVSLTTEELGAGPEGPEGPEAPPAD